ncbi:hypothetical protein [Vibrio vulnificus]|uniref:hypothetical protein n=3 Tax=Vibrio vulnificus TaxID=672 RepID=UPI003D9A8508
MSFSGESGLRKVGLGGIHPLTQRYVLLGNFNMSDLIQEIKSLSSHQIIYSLAFSAAIISPGLLIIFTYKRELFLNLDLIKLLMLSVSLSVPIIVCATLLAVYDTDEQSLDKITFFGYFISLILVYPTLFSAYLLSFSFKTFSFMLLGSYLGLFFMTWFNKKSSTLKKT